MITTIIILSITTLVFGFTTWNLLRKNEATEDVVEEQEKIISPFRKKALLELSKGINSQDKAWALRNIAILMLNGISFDGIQIKTENGVKN